MKNPLKSECLCCGGCIGKHEGNPWEQAKEGLRFGAGLLSTIFLSIFSFLMIFGISTAVLVGFVEEEKDISIDLFCTGYDHTYEYLRNKISN